MNRTILHVDLNNFYASVECLYRTGLRGKPVAVSGNAEARHGIILAKNNLAKSVGVKTGEAIWQAKQKCPDLICVPPDFKKYLRFSCMAKSIYADYTNIIESFGIDEVWLDLSNTERMFGTGEDVATAIRRRLREELGITASVGVSFNKIFAKLGSDMKKPDATTVITEENFRYKVWPLPVGELLYVGRATQRKLANRGIMTIGHLARSDLRELKLQLGVWGETLWRFANGLDVAAVRQSDDEQMVKSIGNSTTTPRDLMNEQDVRLIVYVLAESVAARMRRHGVKCRTVEISVRNTELQSFERQAKLSAPAQTSNEIAARAMELFAANYRWELPIRSLGVRGSDLVTADQHLQLDLFGGCKIEDAAADKAVDDIRRRFGHNSIQRCSMLLDRQLSGFNPKDDHVIHPVGFSK